MFVGSTYLEHVSLCTIRMWKCVPRPLFGISAKKNLDWRIEGFRITGHVIRPFAGICGLLVHLMGLALKRSQEAFLCRAGAGDRTLYSLTHPPLCSNYIRSWSRVLTILQEYKLQVCFLYPAFSGLRDLSISDPNKFLALILLMCTVFNRGLIKKVDPTFQVSHSINFLIQ